MKINAIDNRRDVVPKLDELLAPTELLLFVMRAKRDVMHRTRRNTPNAGVRHAKQINDSAWGALVRGCEPKPVSRFLDQTVTKCVSEQTRGVFITFQSGGNAVESTKRMFRRN